MSTRGEQVAAVWATEEGSAIQVMESIRKTRREFQETLLGDLMNCSAQKKIARIKIVRTHTGLDLKRAKMVVDAINDEIPFLDLAQRGRDQETLQRVGDENSRLRSLAAETEDQLGNARHDLRDAESSLDKLCERYASTQDLLRDARSILQVISNRVSVCPTVSHLVLGASALLNDACDER